MYYPFWDLDFSVWLQGTVRLLSGHLQDSLEHFLKGRSNSQTPSAFVYLECLDFSLPFFLNIEICVILFFFILVSGSSSLLKDSFVGYKILGWQFFLWALSVYGPLSAGLQSHGWEVAYELFEDPPMWQVTSLAAFETGFWKFDYDVSQPGPLWVHRN